MIRLRARYARRSDDGVAMLFVIAIGLIVTAFFVAMFSTVLQTQQSARTQRNITSAQAAAEAGIDDAVFKLGQYTSGTSNWSIYTTGASQWTQAHPFTPTGGFGANANYAVWVTPIAGSSNVMLWSRGTFGSNTRMVRAQISRGSPPAFGYSMFASKGIDIHHHGSSWLSPQVWTTSVHSNGYINIDYSAEFTVNSLEAVGALTLAKGGGSTPGGSIPSTGYNWYDPLNNKCYPGGMANPGGTAPASPGTCSSSLMYSGNAVISGTVKAGSVSINGHGEVVPAAAATLDTGQQILDQPGDVYAGSATIGSSTFSTTAQGDACTTVCKRGASTTAGQIGGALHITPGYAPPTIAFPSIDYSQTYRKYAQQDQDNSGGTVQHVFPGSGAFLSYITNPANGFYRTFGDSTNNYALRPWTPGTAPDVIYLNGNWDITSGSAVLNYSTIASLVNAATSTNGPAPILLIQGSFVVEGGSLKINTGLVMVGPGNDTSFLRAGNATTPVTVDTSRTSTGLLDPAATMPAVLAAGGSIDSSDYDTDSSWTSSSTYEPAKATPTYIRGLVYSASWDPTTQTSVPASQHWHNYDPKNLQKIYGAQVGAQLHDCNNFSFSYDPLVQNAFGFGGGTVSIVDYQELGN